MQFSDIITAKNTRAIWKKLQGGIVPIVDKKDISNVSGHADSLVRSLSNNSYIPSIGHGYLGYLKSAGCTRFVPILTNEDMTVYYLLVLALQDYLVKDLPGVYGAWRSVPKNAVKEGKLEESDEETADNSDFELVDPYFNDTFSKKAWFKDWSEFNGLLIETCNDKTVGNYVLTSDIANFYDTIDVNTLVDRIRSVAPDYGEIISLLGYFLKFWDRRIKGYSASSKGIPQEIISDASRMLANFYLRTFDEKFIEVCKTENVTYIRWADDIVLFGSSPSKLENVMHTASRLLLNIGLNLSAAKTKHFTRGGFRNYRALDLIEAINAKDVKEFLSELKAFSKRYNSVGGRIDTVIKASLNIMSFDNKAITSFSRYYVEDALSNYSNLSLLGERHLLKKYVIFGDVGERLRQDVKIITSFPYAAPRATMLSFLSRNKGFLNLNSVKDTEIKRLIEGISKKNGNSEIIRDICAPQALAKI